MKKHLVEIGHAEVEDGEIISSANLAREAFYTWSKMGRDPFKMAFECASDYIEDCMWDNPTDWDFVTESAYLSEMAYHCESLYPWPQSRISRLRKE